MIDGWIRRQADRFIIRNWFMSLRRLRSPMICSRRGGDSGEPVTYFSSLRAGEAHIPVQQSGREGEFSFILIFVLFRQKLHQLHKHWVTLFQLGHGNSPKIHIVSCQPRASLVSRPWKARSQACCDNFTADPALCRAYHKVILGLKSFALYPEHLSPSSSSWTSDHRSALEKNPNSA